MWESTAIFTTNAQSSYLGLTLLYPTQQKDFSANEGPLLFYCACHLRQNKEKRKLSGQFPFFFKMKSNKALNVYSLPSIKNNNNIFSSPLLSYTSPVHKLTYFPWSVLLLTQRGNQNSSGIKSRRWVVSFYLSTDFDIISMVDKSINHGKLLSTWFLQKHSDSFWHPFPLTFLGKSHVQERVKQIAPQSSHCQGLYSYRP